MSDLLKNLRSVVYLNHGKWCQDAADEIERLTAEVSDLHNVYEAARWLTIHMPTGHIGGLTEQSKYIALKDAVAAVSGSPTPPHGAAITIDDDMKIRTILDNPDDSSPTPTCSYWAMVDKGRTNYPYKEHWADCDICRKRDPNCAEYRVVTADSSPTEGDLDVDGREFRAGVVWAAAELMRGHGDDVYVSDILLAAGFTFEELKESAMLYDFDEIAAFIPKKSTPEKGQTP